MKLTYDKRTDSWGVRGDGIIQRDIDGFWCFAPLSHAWYTETEVKIVYDKIQELNQQYSEFSSGDREC